MLQPLFAVVDEAHEALAAESGALLCIAIGPVGVRQLLVGTAKFGVDPKRPIVTDLVACVRRSVKGLLLLPAIDGRSRDAKIPCGACLRNLIARTLRRLRTGSVASGRNGMLQKIDDGPLSVDDRSDAEDDGLQIAENQE